MTQIKNDWIGNNKSTFSTLGASSHSNTERESNDYYATDPRAVEKLLERETFNKYIWEPACGEKHISNVLTSRGHNVRNSDITSRNQSDVEEIDFMTATKDIMSRDIITNPPYKIATEFIQHALDISMDSTKIAAFLKIQFLESKKRYELFKENPPVRIYVFVNRINCGKNGVFSKEASAVCYAWFIWEKGNKKEPIIRWI